MQFLVLRTYVRSQFMLPCPPMQEGSVRTSARRGRPAEGPRVVVSCAQRKGGVPAERLQARNLPEGRIDARLREWIARLERSSEPRFEARTLYKGEHWAVSAGLADGGDRPGAELWIASAGYGLVSHRSRLVPYAATFATGAADSIVAGGLRASVARREWWKGMAAWGGPDPGAPRSLAALAVADPGRPLVVALGAAYLDAVAEDLLSARRELSTPALLIVISAGTRAVDGLTDNILPVDASAETVLGGSRSSLNARIAAWVLQAGDSHHYDVGRVAALVKEKLSKGVRATPRRTSQDDAAIIGMIERSLARDPSVKKSRLLRAMRDAGLACEQGRFSRLYKSVHDRTPA